MNIQQAKEIKLTDYLKSIGYEPKEINNNNAWYHSPFRPDEKKPSFKVSLDLNKWKDFGISEKGGDIIDLIKKLNSVSTMGALLILGSYANNYKNQHETNHPNLSFFRGNALDKSTFEVNRIKPLQNRALISYIEWRGIPGALATIYCNEVYYNIEGKKYFAIAFRNQSGGHELRNKYWKGCISPKDISIIKAETRQAINIFEGFIDMLSAMVYFKMNKPNCTTIVLNSLVNLSQFYDWVYSRNISKINLFLDNDTAGIEATQDIISKLQHVSDYSHIIYPDYKDFNEFLINKFKIKNI